VPVKVLDNYQTVFNFLHHQVCLLNGDKLDQVGALVPRQEILMLLQTLAVVGLLKPIDINQI
jgi:hypothetical protein